MNAAGDGLHQISLAEGEAFDVSGERATDLQQASEKSEGRPLQAHVTAVYESAECVICLEDANVVLQSCGHLCVCSGCTDLLKGLCPMCRSQVQSSITLDP